MLVMRQGTIVGELPPCGGDPGAHDGARQPVSAAGERSGLITSGESGRTRARRRPAPAPRGAAGIDTIDLLGRFAPLIFLLALVVDSLVLEPGFRTERNIFNVLRQISFIGIIAVGMTFVILTAGIDLSVGSHARLFRHRLRRRSRKGSRSPAGEWHHEPRRHRSVL